MLKSCDIVDMLVSKVEPFGLYGMSDDEVVFVPIPELAWKPVRSPPDLFHVGDTVKVVILRMNDIDHHAVGSIRQLDRQGNPYLAIAQNVPKDAAITGTVVFITKDWVTVELSNGCRGHFPSQNNQHYKRGEVVKVRIMEVDVNNGHITFAQA